MRTTSTWSGNESLVQFTDQKHVIGGGGEGKRVVAKHAVFGAPEGSCCTRPRFKCIGIAGSTTETDKDTT